MRPFLLLVAILLVLSGFVSQAFARLQPPIVCVDPDMEFPVACDDDD